MKNNWRYYIDFMNMIVIVTVMVVIDWYVDMYDLSLYYESLITKLNKKTNYKFFFFKYDNPLFERQY
jgi:hypothetical protein